MRKPPRCEGAICVMYDLSGDVRFRLRGCFAEIYYALLAKRNSLKDHVEILLIRSHNEKPLVTVWGVGFNDHRRYGLDEAEKIINGLKAQGFSVMLGVPTHWRELSGDTRIGSLSA